MVNNDRKSLVIKKPRVKAEVVIYGTIYGWHDRNHILLTSEETKQDIIVPFNILELVRLPGDGDVNINNLWGIERTGETFTLFHFGSDVFFNYEILPFAEAQLKEFKGELLLYQGVTKYRP